MSHIQKFKKEPTCSLNLMVSAAEHHKGRKEAGMFWKLVHVCDAVFVTYMAL